MLICNKKVACRKSRWTTNSLEILINPSYHFNGDVDVVDFVAQMHIVEYAFVSFIIT